MCKPLNLPKFLSAMLVFLGLLAQPLSAQTVDELLQAQTNERKRIEVTAQDGGVGSAPAVVEEKVETVDAEDAVFGDQIFTGAFRNQNFVGFNPDYQVAVGDRIVIRLWGGVQEKLLIEVDAQGNVFIPRVGPVQLQGVRNVDLNKVVNDAVRQQFTDNVGVYASLEGAEPVKVFVTGFVRKPGMYAGHASDSVLYFLDSADGVDPQRGSYLDIHVLRRGQLHRRVNLYDFLRDGSLPRFQIADGDTIVVKAAKSRAQVSGLVLNPYVFEFEGDQIAAADLFALAGPQPQVTHARITRNNLVKNEVTYVPVAEAEKLQIFPGDVVELMSDKVQGTISVRIEGEHFSQKEYVVPYGAKLGDLLGRLNFGPNAQKEAIQLERASVKIRQKEALEAQLRSLESSVLTAQSRTNEEAALRRQEAQLVLQWVERAREIEPRGLVTIASSDLRDEILLEPGDVIYVPRVSNLVMVHGEVLFPSAMTFTKNFTVQDYIDQAGGFTQGKSRANVLLLHRDGTFEKVKTSRIGSSRLKLRPGDEIFVLPKVQQKNFQFAKDIIQILYQVALSAGVVLAL